MPDLVTVELSVERLNANHTARSISMTGKMVTALQQVLVGSLNQYQHGLVFNTIKTQQIYLTEPNITTSVSVK